MTKQEEIDGVFHHYLESICCAMVGLSDYKCKNAPPLICENGGRCLIIGRCLPDFKKDLSDLGVVLKVADTTQDIAGFNHPDIVVESLIKDG